MNHYGAFSDDFYVNMHLQTEMDLPQQRESILHFFEQVQRRFPKMKNFYARDRGEFVLEEDKDQGGHRWVSAETKRICSGTINPNVIEDAIHQHQEILNLVPHALSISHLDCESLNLIFGFDYVYRGNHNQLLADTLGLPAAFEPFSELPGAFVMGYEPGIQLSLDEDCRTVARISFEPRTTAYHIRSGDYPEEHLSVYLTLRRFDSLNAGESFTQEVERLANIGQDIINNYLLEHILRPLQQRIALK